MLKIPVDEPSQRWHAVFLKKCGVSIAYSAIAFMVALLWTASLSAQTAGTISGHVSDPSGAVIPGATVTLTNVATNATRTTVSTSAGDYTFPYVLPGIYNIQATHSGFKAASSQNVQLQIQQSLTQNFSLQVGQVSQTVTVEATGALLQTQDTTLGTVVPTETLSQMPNNSRNYLNMVAVSANANTVSPDQGQGVSRLGGARASESISVGGARIMYDHYTLDGINNSDPDFNTFIVQPSIDAIQEMKVQTGVYPAEFGYNATQVNVVTKSGGNQYHGTAFDFVRNNYADALGYCYNYPTPCPAALPFKYNDYGFVLNGPIRIPHLYNGKDKFFFMVNDEWYSQISYTTTERTQPSAALIGTATNGADFSSYTGTKQGGPVVPIYDPATGNPDGTGRTQFPGNIIPANRIDPISLKFVQLYSAPAQTTAFTNNYQFLTDTRDDHDGFSARGDYYQSAKLQWAFRFSNGRETNPTSGFATAGGTVGSNIITTYYQYMGSNTWTISPTVVNVATFGYTRFINDLGLLSQGVDDDVAKIGIPNLAPGDPSTWGIPATGYTGDLFSGLGDSSDGPYDTNDPNTTVNDKIAWVHGKHSVGLGFQYERQVFNEYGNQESRGNFTFLANATAQVVNPGTTVAGTGSAYADFLLGEIQQDVYAVSVAQANYVRNVEAAYIDDNVRLTPKLSIQAGLRYELTPPWYDTLGNEFIVDLHSNSSPIDPFISGPEPQNLWPIFTREGNCTNAYSGINVTWTEGATNDPSNPNAPVNPGPQCANGNFPNTLMEVSHLDFAPRFGLSYNMSPSVVVRAGYGIYFNHDTANARFDVARNLAGRVTQLSGGGSAGVATIQWDNAIATGAGAVVPYPYTYSNQYEHKTPNTQEYLLDIQKQLGTNWKLEVGYLGTLSSHLEGFRNPDYSIPYGLLGVAGYYPAGVSSTTAGTTASRGTCAAVTVAQCGGAKSIPDRSPYPNYEVIQLVHDVGIARYNAFTFQVNKHFSGGFNLISSYTFSKSLDDTSGIRTQSSRLFPQSDLCITCEYGPSDFDVRNRVVGSLIYDLPIGAGRMWAPSNKAVDAVIGGWEYSIIGTIQGGLPFNMTYNDDNAQTNTIEGGTYPTRPNYVAGQSFILPNHRAGKNGQWVNPAAFTEPAPGFLGSTSRNMLRGAGYQNFDMSVDKNFNMPYNEHHQFQIRFDAFNSLNHTNFGLPNSAYEASNAGLVTSTNGNARELQLAARYTF